MPRGGAFDAQYIYELEVQPKMATRMSLDNALKHLNDTKGEEFAAQWLNGLRQRAHEMQEKHGGLYKGQMDHLRATMCDVDNGNKDTVWSDKKQSCIAF